MQPTSTLRCSNCGQPINARVYSYIDVQKEPQAKAALINQQLNRFQCPNCGNVTAVSAPVLYHDASKELLISFSVPANARNSTVGYRVAKLQTW